MPGGRPTKYTEEFLEIARRYLENYADGGHVIPSISGLAVVSEVRRSTLYAWAEEEGKEEFSDILAKILAKQESLLINKGLTSEFNSNITKLVLGKHGYHEKQEISGGFNITMPGKDADTL